MTPSFAVPSFNLSQELGRLGLWRWDPHAVCLRRTLRYASEQAAAQEGVLFAFGAIDHGWRPRCVRRGCELVVELPIRTSQLEPGCWAWLRRFEAQLPYRPADGGA
jgi:hypothetical protein